MSLSLALVKLMGILHTFCNWWAGIQSLSFSWSQDFLIGSMKCDTKASLLWMGERGVTCPPWIPGTQESFQKWIESPLPTLHWVPFRMIFRPSSKLVHNHEDLGPPNCLLPRSIRKIHPFESLITLAQKASGELINLKNCLASKARLKVSKSLKPKPPLNFGSKSFAHAPNGFFFQSQSFPTKNRWW